MFLPNTGFGKSTINFNHVTVGCYKQWKCRPVGWVREKWSHDHRGEPLWLRNQIISTFWGVQTLGNFGTGCKSRTTYLEFKQHWTASFSYQYQRTHLITQLHCQNSPNVEVPAWLLFIIIQKHHNHWICEGLQKVIICFVVFRFHLLLWSRFFFCFFPQIWFILGDLIKALSNQSSALKFFRHTSSIIYASHNKPPKN